MSNTDEMLIERAADIVSAYVQNNSVQADKLPEIIASVHHALTGLAGRSAAEEPAPVAKAPAVSVKKSISADYLICLEDGRKFKSLKRHLRTAYNMTPDEYRTKWSLPRDYPMVAPDYAARRSALAKDMGLGQARKRA